MSKDKVPRAGQQNSIEYRAEELLQKALALQKSDPVQARLLATELAKLAGKSKLYYHLACARKTLGNLEFLRNDSESAKRHYNSALIPARKANDPKLLGDLYYNLGRVHTRLKDYEAALQHLHRSLPFRKNLQDRKDEINSLSHIGQAYWELQNYQEAARVFQAASLICDASTDPKQTAAIFNNLGNAYVKTEETHKAMEAYIYSLKLKETLGDATDLATVNLNLGNLYYFTANYSGSIVYYNEATRLYGNVGDHARQAMVLTNLGATYNALKDFDRAASFHQMALEYFKQHEMWENYAKSLNSIGTIFQYKGEYHKAIEIYQTSLGIKSSFNNPESLAYTHNNLSECSYCLGDYHVALEHTQKSMEYSSQIQSKTLILKNYRQLAKIFAALRDYQNAYEALNNYLPLDMDVYNEERNKILAEAMAHYETDQKEKEITRLKTDQHIMEEMFSRQAKDKLRYLRLYRSKLAEVKKRVAIQNKLKQLNADLEMRINQAVQDYKAQQLLIIQKSKLESLGVMAAGMAHEINQPLSAITMSFNNLRFKARNNELNEAYLEDKTLKIMDDIKRIRSVIDHVRQFSRDQVYSDLEHIDIHTAITAAVNLISYDLSKRNIMLRLKLTDQPLIVVGRRYMLEQVFLNLLTNARDAIQEKNPEGRLMGEESVIEIITSRLQDSAEIVFCDNGTGMSDASIAKMFDPFYTTKSPERGTGLGLSISYGIITEMGGKIIVCSDPGRYTKIAITLPILEGLK